LETGVTDVITYDPKTTVESPMTNAALYTQEVHSFRSSRVSRGAEVAPAVDADAVSQSKGYKMLVMMIGDGYKGYEGPEDIIQRAMASNAPLRASVLAWSNSSKKKIAKDAQQVKKDYPTPTFLRSDAASSAVDDAAVPEAVKIEVDADAVKIEVDADAVKVEDESSADETVGVGIWDVTETVPKLSTAFDAEQWPEIEKSRESSASELRRKVQARP
jgi:hypothetical protein